MRRVRFCGGSTARQSDIGEVADAFPIGFIRVAADCNVGQARPVIPVPVTPNFFAFNRLYSLGANPSTINPHHALDSHTRKTHFVLPYAPP